MKILSINNSNNQITHKAVNKQYLKQARDNFMRYAPCQNQGHLLTMIGIDIAYGLLKPQDAIDTLEAIKPYSKDALEVINSMIIRLKKLISTP